MSEFVDFLWTVLKSAVNMINGASYWMVLSLIVAGCLHEFLTPEALQKSNLGTTKPTGVLWATLTGMLIPICSCGSIPLGIGLYHSGAYLGPTLAFMTSSPMINPISIILCYGLLGPEIATVYVITGFVAPMIIGLIANRFAGDELYLKREDNGTQRIQLEMEKPSVPRRILMGLRWSFSELALMIGKYTVLGMLTAALIFSIFPQTAIQRYLGDPSFISLLGITVIAAVMYVCAVGHIPFIAAIVASGAAPGVAITFLMAGAATNISELITINRTIGKRAMLMYFGLVVFISNFVGYLTNQLFPDFVPVLNYDAVTHSISAANTMMHNGPDWLKYVCTCLLVCYALYAGFSALRSRLRKLSARRDAETV
ncbi:hypothetical protein B5E80_07990 [Flavonifractor sp. An135]|nr:efflux transporter SaoE [Flavonifractor sp. An135]OUQ24203.1 hypothetical protein B5E80_07990 [Flavonifractor sp. An135]